MANVFGHNYEIYIVRPYEVHKSATGGDTGNNIITDGASKQSIPTANGFYRVVYDESLLIKPPLQMEAKVRYDSADGGNTSKKKDCEVKLYNLSKNTLNQIKTGSTILIKAGYVTDKELPILFTGTISKVSTRKENTEVVTTIIAEEGKAPEKLLNNTFQYALGVDTYETILIDIASYLQTVGVTIKLDLTDSEYNSRQTHWQLAPAGTSVHRPLKGFDIKRSPQRAMTYTGNVFSSLTKVCMDINYVWFFSRGVLYIQPKELARLHDFYEINAHNVIGTLLPIDDDETNKQTKETKITGVAFTTYLNCKISIENYIKVAYGDYKGDYKPTSIEHDLNWADGPWTTRVQTKAIEAYELNQKQ